MFHYSKYAGNAEPVGWALRQSGHGICCHSSYFSNRYVHRFNWYDVSGSRLLYSFGRDGLLPPWLSKLNHKHLPNRALLILTIIGINWFNVPICILGTTYLSRNISRIYVCVSCNVSFKKT